MPDPILHVIYAGFGDCMVLETDNGQGGRQFILVDGGPKSYIPAGKNGGTAPYHRYLESARRAIMQNRDLDGVIISHPDEDHYGGYKHSIHSNALLPPPILFVPAAGDRYATDNRPVAAIFPNNTNIVMGRINPNAQDYEYLFPSIKAIYPPINQIEYHYNPNVNQRGIQGGYQFSAHDNTNHRSILMYTEAPQLMGQSRAGIFFTGDSHADIIAEQIAARFGAPPVVPRFGVYKIQHHGSYIDNQWKFYNPYMRAVLCAEVMILGLIRVYRNDPPYLSDPDGHNARVIMKVAGRLMRLLKDLFKENTIDGAKSKAYAATLAARIKAVHYLQLDTLQPGPNEKVVRDTTLELPIIGRAYHPTDRTKKVPKPETNGFELAVALDVDVTAILNRAEHAVWVKYVDDWTSDLTTYIRVRNIRDFYLKFESDVYVVSASGVHGHPRPELIIGLALAVRKQDRQARLYVTDGSSIDVAAIRRMVLTVDLGTVQELFEGNHLQIAYLATGTYMSISGESRDRGQQPDPILDRDLSHKSRILRISDNNQKEARDRLHDLFKYSPDRALLGCHKFTIKCFENPTNVNSVRYLYLKEGTFGMIEWQLTPAGQNGQPAISQYVWIEEDYIPDVQNGLNIVRCRANRFGNMFDEVMFIPTGGTQQNPTWGIDSVHNAQAVYWHPQNGITFGVPQRNEQLVDFVITEEVDREEANVAVAVGGPAVGAEAVDEEEEEAADEDETKVLAGAVAAIDLVGSETNFLALTKQEETAIAKEIIVVSSETKVETEITSANSAWLNPSNGTSDLLTRIRAAIRAGGGRRGFDVLSEEEKQKIIAELTLSDTRFSLRAAFRDEADPIHEVDRPNLIEVLTQLYLSNHVLEGVLVRKMPDALLRLGFDTMTVDLDQSTAVLAVRPGRNHTIDRARIVCCRPAGSAWPESIEMAGFGFRVNGLVLEVMNCRTARASLRVEGSVTLVTNGSATGIDLKISWTSSQLGTAISFQAGVESIQDLVSGLSGSNDVLSGIHSLGLPLMSVSEGQPGPTLGSITVPKHAIGFTLVQPTDLVEQYHLADIWVRTTFSDWKAFLPVPERFKDVDGAAKVRVLHPFEGSARRIAVDVEFELPIPTPKGPVDRLERYVSARFSAIPLSQVGDYEYQFQIIGTSERVTVPEVTAAIGLQDVSANMIGTLPALETVLNTVRIRELGVAVSRAESGSWSFQEWTLDMYVPKLELMQGAVFLTDAFVRIEKGWDEMRAKGKAVFWSPKVDKQATIEFMLPRAEVKEGHITFDAPGGLSLSDAFAIFDVGDLTAVPVLGEFAKRQLIHCRVGLVQKPKPDGGVIISSFAVTIRDNDFSIGPLKLDLGEFSIEWRRTTAKDGTVGSVLKFEIRALFKDAHAAVYVTYDGAAGTVSARIKAVNTGKFRVAALLGELVPGAKSALHDALGDLAMQHAAITLDVQDLHPTSFDVWFEDGAKLKVPAAREDRALVLHSLRLTYTEEEVKPEPELEPVKPNGDEPVEPKPNEPKVKSKKYKFVLHAMLDINTSETTIAMAVTLSAVVGSTDRTIDFQIAVVGKERLGLGGHGAEIQSSKDLQSGTIEDAHDPGLDAFAAHLGLEVTDATISKPEGCPAFVTGLAEIRGKFSTAKLTPTPAPDPEPASVSEPASTPVSKPKLSLIELGFRVETGKRFTVVEDPSIVLEKMYLEVMYRAGSTSSGSEVRTNLPPPPSTSSLSVAIFGMLLIADSVPVKVGYVNHKDVHVFTAVAGREQPLKLDAVGVLGQFLRKEDYDLAKVGTIPARPDATPRSEPHLNFPIDYIALVFEPKKAIEIAAYGSSVWTGTCAGAVFTLKNVGVRVRVSCVAPAPLSNPTNPGQKYRADVFVYGELEMPGFLSATAMLNIGYGQHSMLTAIIEPNVKDESPELTQLIETIPHDGGSWAELAAEPMPVRFGSSAELLVNFTTGLVFVRGELTGVGRAVVLANTRTKPDLVQQNPEPGSARYEIYVDICGTRLDQLWRSDDLAADLADLHINRVNVKVLTFDTTAGELRSGLDWCDQVVRANTVGYTASSDVLAVIGSTSTPAPPPATQSVVLKEDEVLTAGATFAVEIGIGGSGELMEAMIEATDPKGPAPAITLFAHFNRSNRAYSVFVRQWELVDRMVIVQEASGTYKPAVLGPNPQKAILEVHAEIEVHLETILKLQIHVIASARQAVIRGEVSKAVVSNVFKDMFNVTLFDLYMEGVFSKKEKRVSIFASVTFGSSGKDDPQSNWVGEIHFRDGKPQAVMIEYNNSVRPEDRALTGTDAFNSLIKTGQPDDPGLDWPANLPPVTFLNAYVYYNGSTQFEAAGRVYQPGFWLGAQLSLFHAEFDVQAHIWPDRSGMTISAQLKKPIIYEFVQFIGPVVKPEASSLEPEPVKEIIRAPGPRLEIEARKEPSFLITAGLVLFDASLPDITIGWSADEQAFYGETHFVEGVMAGVTLTLYYKNGRFYFGKWAAFRDGDDLKINIDNAIGEGSKGQKCGELVEKLFTENVKAKFRFGLDPPKDLAKLLDNEGLHLVVPWTVEISVLGKVVGEVWIMDLALVWERPFKIDNIWATLASEALKNVAKIGIAIMKNPAVFGKLLALVGSEKLAIRTLSQIFCREVDDKEWVEKTRKYTRSKWKELLEEIKKVWDLIKKIKELVEKGKWFLALLEFLELLWILIPLLILLVLLLVLIGWLIKIATKHKDEESKNEMSKLQKEVEDEHKRLSDARDETIRDFGKYVFNRGDASARFLDGSDDTICVRWNKLTVPDDKGEIAFTATIATNDRFENAETVAIQGQDPTSLYHQNLDYKFAPEIYIRLAADITIKYEDGIDKEGKPLTATTEVQHIECVVVASHRAEPPTPTDLEFMITGEDCPQMCATWNARAGFQYEVVMHASSTTNIWQTLHHSFLDRPSQDGRLSVVADLRSRDSADLRADADTIVYKVRAVHDESRYTDSPWAECQVSHPARRFVNDLRAEPAGTYIAISWAEIECEKYRVRLYQDQDFSTALVEKTITVLDGRAGRLGSRIRVPDNLPDNTQLNVAVQAVDIPDKMCPVWTETTVAVAVSSRPPVTITDEDYKTAIMQSTSELRLAVTMPWRFDPAIHRLAVVASGPSQEETMILSERITFSPSHDGKSGSIRISGFSVPYPTHLTVLTEKPSVPGSTPVRGPAWSMFAIPTEPVPAVSAIDCRIHDGRLCVQWEYPAGVDMVQVRATGGEKTATMYSRRTDSVGSNGEIYISGLSVAGLEETIFDIRIVSMVGSHVFGRDTTVSWKAPPPYELWTAPKTAFPGREQVVIGSGLVAGEPARIPTLFWFEGNQLVAGGRESTHPVLSSDRVSSLAAGALGPDYQEVFYVNGNSFIGTTRGAEKAGHLEFSSPTDLGFGPITPCRRPGLLFAIADKSSNTSHLWWIGPTNQTQTAANTVWYAFRGRDGDWSKPEPWMDDEHAVYVDDAGPTSLAAMVTDEYATVYFHSASDRLVSVTRRLVWDGHQLLRPESALCLILHDFGDSPTRQDEYTVEPDSGRVVIRYKSENFLFWITKSGAIMSSRDDPGDMWKAGRKKVKVKGSRMGDAEVAPPGTASARSDIAAVWTPTLTTVTGASQRIAPGGGGSENVMEDQELHLFFFAPNGRLMGARGTVGDWGAVTWTFYELAPEGSSPAEGRMSVVVTKWDEPLVRVWWINRDRQVQWQAPTTVLQKQ